MKSYTQRFPEAQDTLNFAIIGVQKASTTSIQDYLHAHPGVCMPMGEIACFESPDFEQGRPAAQLTFTAEAEGRMTGIKRPNIFPDPLAVQRLKRHSPGCKLIVVLRDPVNRFVSAYFHVMNSGKIPVMDINRAMALMFDGDYLSRYPAALTLLHYGLYADRLDDIAHNWGEEALYVTSHRRVGREQRAVLGEICRFLGLEFIEPQTAEVWRNKGSYDYQRARLLRPSNAAKYSYSAGRMRKEVRDNFVARVVGGGLARLARAIPTRKLPADAVLNEVSRTWLTAYFASDRERLKERRPDVVYW